MNKPFFWKVILWLMDETPFELQLRTILITNFSILTIGN
jgi:hypothetical protein